MKTLFSICVICTLIPFAALAAPDKPTPHVGSYMRFVQNDTDNFSLELAVRTFIPQDNKHSRVTLISAIHIGSKEYYTKLQHILDSQKLLFFEGVGNHHKSRKKLSSLKTLKTNKKEEDGNASPVLREEENEEKDLYTFIATASGLHTQTKCIKYDREHFKNADMSMSQMREILHSERKLGGKRAREATEALALLKEFETALSGSGGLSMFFVRGMLYTMKDNPALRTLFLFNLATADDEQRPPAFLSGMTRLWHLILHDRNKVAMTFLKKELDSESPAQEIGIFYGAAHMRGMEEILVHEMNYKLVETKWLTAYQLHPKRSGLNDIQCEIFNTHAKKQREKQMPSPSTKKHSPIPQKKVIP
ncbi:MAG: hypothetical protein LBD01_04850 [Puniceicoccales bacterium]|nr:hypothetical protein [Puniceicoccales bacterium]